MRGRLPRRVPAPTPPTGPGPHLDARAPAGAAPSPPAPSAPASSAPASSSEGCTVVGAVAGVGVDAVDIGRFRAVLERRPTMAGRLFTAGERADAARRADPVPSLAARFAAKEATWKVLGVGLGAVAWQDVAVLSQPSGAPVLTISGRAAQLASAAGCRRWHLSLTHTETVAIATVVAETGGSSAAGGVA